MAFQGALLPDLAAITTDIWPLVANNLPVPWRGPSTPKPAPSRRQLQRPEQRLASLAPASALRDPVLPDFLRDTSSDVQPTFSTVTSSSATAHDIRSSIANLPPISLASAANPLIRKTAMLGFSRQQVGLGRRLFSSATVSRPRDALNMPGGWGFRALPARHPLMPLSPVLQFGTTPLRAMALRRAFGTSGISRNLLANREAAANRNPSSATAQNAFYQVLLKANMPAIIVERYQSGRYARNEAVDEVYNHALAILAGSATAETGVMGVSGGTHPSGLTPAQLQAVGQALAAHSKGSNLAVAKGPQGTGTRDGPIHVVVDETIGGVLFRWVKFILWFCLFTYLSLVVITMMIEGLNQFKRTNTRTDLQTKPENQTARFSDVHGCEEAKEELQELVEFLRNPDKFSTLGGKLPKGILLVGPPGTGKTLLARAVAGEAGVPFFYMSGSEFDEVYVGVGAKRVRELFTSAKSKAPAIVFIDELDAIGGRRNARDAAYVKQTLNQLLTELDGFEQNSGVIILAATNFPELLDKALTRPGRFDRHVVVGLPDVRGRLAILEHHAKKIKMAKNVKFEPIAQTTSGLSGAELENIVNQAAVHASKAKAEAVSMKDLDWARDKIIMGAERKTMVISAKEKEMTAYHEAGHALVNYYAKSHPGKLYKVTILPRGMSLGHTSYLPEMDRYSQSVQDYLAMIEAALGGKLAEEIVYGSDMTTSGVSSDLESATNIAFAMVAQLGMSEKLGPVEYKQRYEQLSSETRSTIETEVQRLLSDAYERGRKLLLSKRKELDLLAKALVEYETLDREEVEKVIRGEKLVNRMPVPKGPMTIPKVPNPLDSTVPLPPSLGGDNPPPSPPPPPSGPGGIVAGSSGE